MHFSIKKSDKWPEAEVSVDAVVEGSVEIGMHTVVCPGVILDGGKGGIKIGPYCVIRDMARIINT